MAFCYERLNLQNREIRVCILQPGKFNDAISCIISTVSLNDNPRYEALSYVWGDQSLTERIMANSSTIATTKNLYTALRYLRSDIVPRVVWADALCINQLDTDERSSQVGIMGDIYRQALEVQIWSGEVEDMAPDRANSPEESLVSWDHVEVFKTFLQSNDLMTSVSPLSSANGHITDTTEANLTGALEILRLLREDKHFHQMPFFKVTSAAEIDLDAVWYDALRTLTVVLTTAWWTRVWIVQEAVLSAGAMVHIGKIEVPLSHFRNAAQNLNKHHTGCCASWYELWHGYHDIFASLIKSTQYVVQLDEMMEGKRSVTISQAIRMSKTRKASDPRDHVYAFDALLKPSAREFTTPDYGLSTADVFEEATVGMLAGMGTLAFLIYAQGVKDDNRFQLPSWVCDWSDESILGVHFYMFDAAIRHQHEFQPTDRTYGSLDIQGLEVDFISVLGTNFEGSTNVQKIISQVDEWKELMGPRKAETPHALFRAIFHDTTHHLPRERRFLPEDFRIVEDWWLWIESLGKRTDTTEVPQTFPTPEIGAYHMIFIRNALDGAIFASSRSTIGRSQRTVREGDRIFILKGDGVPLILRPRFSNVDNTGDSPTHESQVGYLFVGHCYLEGIMDGEATTEDSRWQHLRLY